MRSCQLSSFAKVLRGSFERAISNAGKCGRKQGRGVYAVRRLAIHVKKALIFREIASWAERSAFPKWQEGRHPHCHFRGLLRLYSRYGPSNRSAAQRRPLSRGFDPASYPAESLVSFWTNRQL